MHIQPVIEYNGSFKRKARGFTKELKKAMREVLVRRYWRQWMPGRFTKAAYTRYPDVFKKRYTVTRRWRERNFKLQRYTTKKLRAPMVWTGGLKRSVVGTTITVRGTAKRMKAYLRGSSVANFHTGTNDRTGGYDMVAELRALTDGQIRLMAEDMERRLARFLNRRRPRRRIKAKG